MFECIIRYWILDMAKTLENSCSVCVDIWDVTEGNVSKKYEGGSVWLRKVYSDDFSLWCIELFKDRGFSDGDEIGLYWDPRFSCLVNDYSLSIVKLIKDCRLGFGDGIGLYRHPSLLSRFIFRLFSKVHYSRIRPIKKNITHDEIVVGMLMIPFFELFEYILRYWTLDMVKTLENGCSVC
ncbi:hypothetical protein H5410_051767 [Solanum commersonii]|uniref:Uncharacterized protein n=1 Tax=Solanum commersonii TaxID=4109 RepID=A0A9J5X1G6_SOLCO|nr:hypothetical protein H5410_051767 [Solanum commersonii]